MTMIEEELHKTIEGIKFGILSPNEIRTLSVAEIQMADTYDEDGAPITSGLMDGRLEGTARLPQAVEVPHGLYASSR